MAESIRFLGFESDIPAFLALIDVFVLSSLWEGMPFAILEAMAAGRPQAVTDVDGCRELVVEGETGLLVPYGDVPAMADAALSLLRESFLGADPAHPVGDQGKDRRDIGIGTVAPLAALGVGQIAETGGLPVGIGKAQEIPLRRVPGITDHGIHTPEFFHRSCHETLQIL